MSFFVILIMYIVNLAGLHFENVYVKEAHMDELNIL